MGALCVPLFVWFRVVVFVYRFVVDCRVYVFLMLVTMVFNHQSDVSLSLSYSMVGSSNKKLLVSFVLVYRFDDDCRL